MPSVMIGRRTGAQGLRTLTGAPRAINSSAIVRPFGVVCTARGALWRRGQSTSRGLVATRGRRHASLRRTAVITSIRPLSPHAKAADAFGPLRFGRMKVSSPVGDYPYVVKKVRFNRGRLIVEGSLGMWDTTME